MNKSQGTNTTQSDCTNCIAEPMENGAIIVPNPPLDYQGENDLPFDIEGSSFKEETKNNVDEGSIPFDIGNDEKNIEKELTGEDESNDDNDEDALFCYECGERIYGDDYYDVYVRGEREAYCQECKDEHCFYCNDCESYHLDTENHIEYRGNYICNDCSSDYSYCDGCGRYVHYDDYNGNRERCYECMEDNETGVEDYHQNDDWNFIGDCKPSWKGAWRGLGVELEIDRDDRDMYAEKKTVSGIRDIYDNLKFEYDGSLEYGFEIITHPHTLDAFQKIDWAGILDVCRVNGYTSHNANRCGLHIHFSRTMFGTDEKRQADSIAKLIKFFEAYWGDILKVSRRTQEQADQYAKRYWATDNKDAKRLGKSKGEGRYYAVNNSNHDTVEIRIMRGTLNVRSFLSCIDFCVCIVKNSRNIPWKDIWNVDKWLKGIHVETREYIRFRNAFKSLTYIETIKTSVATNFTEEVA